MLQLEGHRRCVRALAYCPTDPALLASTGDDGVTHLWNPATGELRSSLRRNLGGQLCLAFSSDGHRLVTGGRDGTLHVWDVALARYLDSLAAHQGEIVAVAFKPGDQTLLAVPRGQRHPGESGPLLYWRLPDRHRTYRDTQLGVIQSMALDSSGTLLALADDHRSLEVWDASLREQKATMRVPNRVRGLCFSPRAGSGLLAVASGRGVLLWDAHSRKKQAFCKGHRTDIRGLAFTPDGRLLVTGSIDKSVRLWDVETGQEKSAYDWEIGRVQCVAVCSHGMTAAAGGEYGELMVWDLPE
jgi:WD40 repeat protein